MGKLSMSLALVALLAVAGTYAARPIDVSNEESIKPMNTLEEQVVSDSSRELLSMHYPPPPPLSETQGSEGRPTITQAISLSFNSSEHASNFSSAVGTVRCPREGDCTTEGMSRKLLSMHGPAQDFAEEYLKGLLAASAGNKNQDTAVAEDGVVTVSATDADATMTSTLYYPDGTTQEQLDSDSNNDLSSRNIVPQSEYENLADTYGISTDYGTFSSAATSSFESDEDPMGGGAQGLKASLFMGVAVILSAFLLA